MKEKGKYMFTTSTPSVRRAELADDQIRTLAPSVFAALPAPQPQMVPNSYQEPKPTKLLKITERFYGRVIYTSQADIDRANQLGRPLIRCRCLNGRLVSHHHEEMGWHDKVGTVFHREYLDGATIEEVEVKP
jgi:hypothetical protein